MTNSNHPFQRMGGASAEKLVSDPLHKLAGTVEALISPEELTGLLWKRLAGTWSGNKGWNLVALPAPGSIPTDKGDFVLRVDPFFETLSFADAGAPAPNRGGKVDQFVGALIYEQRISNNKSSEALHVETGMFLNLSAKQEVATGKQQPIPQFNIARSGTIPHGDSIMLLGRPPLRTSSAPDFFSISSLPELKGNPPLGYTDAYLNGPQGVDLVNLHQTLKADLDTQLDDGYELLENIFFQFDSNNEGGILNVPFVRSHANVSWMQANFWLERIRHKESGHVFDQLQYSQIINLDFHRQFDGSDELIQWPHVTINTLVKQ